MSAKLLLEYADICTLFVTMVLLVVMWRKSLLAKFSMVAAYLFSVALHQSINIPILFFRRLTPFDRVTAYKILFDSNIGFFLVSTVLMIAIIYSVFHIAMSPLKGIQRIGSIVFRWVAVVSVLLGLMMALGPHLLFSSSAAAYTNAFERVQEGVSVLTLCLLAFVCFAIKPLGLTYRSHIFGITLGLGLMSATQLVEAAWLSTAQGASVYSPIWVIIAVASILAFGIWGTYFAMPEPERRMITLPTTSPFLAWNRLAEALGVEPGHVAISLTPSMFAPAEIRAMETINKYTLKRQAEAKAAAELQNNAVLNDIAAS